MSGMAEVLAAHTAWATTNPDDEWLVICVDCKATLGTYESIVPKDVDRDGRSYDLLDDALAVHQAEVLAAAGFGPVKEAAAVALEEAAAKALGPSDVLLDAATCRWISMELREHAAAVRGEG